MTRPISLPFRSWPVPALLSASRRHPALGAAFLVGPAIAWIMLFAVIPLLLIAAYSFMRSGGSGAIVPIFTIENYSRILTSSLYRRILFESLAIGVESTAITLLLGYPVGYYLGRMKSSVAPFLLLLIVLPFWTSYLVRIFSWLLILMDNGVINWVLSSINATSSPLHLLYSHLGVVIGIVYSALPFAILPIYAVVKGIEQDLVDAAHVLGADEGAAFREVIFPLSLPGLAAAAILTFIYAVGSFLAPAILGGTGAVMISNVIINTFLVLFNWPFACALTVALLLIMLIVLAAAGRLVSLENIYGLRSRV
ncbi:ABC transporter permease [Bradyrhizobium sp. SRL28]|uniref:ABC transporter permease n=1 Tax=Bradyrhizobium sp. SRL28 TaxID=2836178 RepID=UPI001BDE16D0|nr:ABC transporter permease [Bradyrhizobium sp. SRL28]MBT1517371.1 ABC transporter permease [Bradyrhizobium sp. SRL28]